jgi:GMP synthase (glutamine-hydrolysing)
LSPSPFLVIANEELAKAFIAEKIEDIRSMCEEKMAFCPVTGDLRSYVASFITVMALGEKAICVNIDHGFMFQNESETIMRTYREKLGKEVVFIDASERFFSSFDGVCEGLKKRRLFNREFLGIINETLPAYPDADFICYPVIYTDILEELSRDKRIKVRSPMYSPDPIYQIKPLEPIIHLYPDELRVIGKALGLPNDIVYSRPVLAQRLVSRCTGAVTKERIRALRHADAILCEEFEKNSLCDKVWQYFIILPDIKSVGVKDESRYEGWPAIIRAVNTMDAMTATIEEIPYEVLHKITSRIIGEVEGINRVLYDLTPKPTGTIEWE